jgi:hypothetical protein
MVLMPDPILSERDILHRLDVPAGVASFDRLQTAAMLSIVDGFDRKIQRDPFVHLTGAALSLHANLSRLQLLDLLIEHHAKQTLTLDTLARSNTELVAYCEAARRVLVTKVELIAECSTSHDKIH